MTNSKIANTAVDAILHVAQTSSVTTVHASVQQGLRTVTAHVSIQVTTTNTVANVTMLACCSKFVLPALANASVVSPIAAGSVVTHKPTPQTAEPVETSALAENLVMVVNVSVQPDKQTATERAVTRKPTQQTAVLVETPAPPDKHVSLVAANVQATPKTVAVPVSTPTPTTHTAEHVAMPARVTPVAPVARVTVIAATKCVMAHVYCQVCAVLRLIVVEMTVRVDNVVRPVRANATANVRTYQQISKTVARVVSLALPHNPVTTEDASVLEHSHSVQMHALI